MNSDVVHLWWGRVDALQALLGPNPERLLDPADAALCDRFRQAADRTVCTLSRLGVRRVLAHHTGQKPETLRFTRNAWGKPALQSDAPIYFNISHTREALVIAVRSSDEVGVDIEGGHPLDVDVAADVLHPQELAQLLGRPIPQQHATFLQFWTLKEAFIKACGRGLSIPLKLFAFQLAALPPETEPNVQPAPMPPPTAFHLFEALKASSWARHTWRFRLWSVNDHMMALAMPHGPETIPEVRVTNLAELLIDRF